MTDSPTHSPTSTTDLGLVVRRHRRAAGLTQEELAERAGISARAVSDIERGLRSGIYRDTADRLVSALRLEATEREELIEAARRSPVVDRAGGRLPPLAPAPLRGRASELTRLDQLLGRAATGLVTLTGPPGIGKSRLALEAAHAAAARGTAVWFVPLAGLSSADGVPTAVLSALDLPDTGQAAERIAQRLPARAVLVLDNFEHVLDATTWLSELLQAAPLTVLTTSRAPLRLRVELEIAVLPLEAEPALELFIDRTEALGRHASWSEPDLRLAAEICARLDHLPLALELGAAALKHLTLSSLAEALDQHLDVLGEGWRDMPQRHRSMRAAVAWSADLLSPADRELLVGLAAFAGTFGIDAVAEVAALDRAVAVRRLARLVEQSLVQVAGELRGWPRYQLLEVVRQAAFDEARAAGTLAGYRLRHLDHFLSVAEEAEPNLHGSLRQEWFERLVADSDNLDAALDFATESGETDRGLRLATALWRWWRQRGTLNAGRAHFRRLLALPGGSVAIRSRALWGASWLALHQQDLEDSRALSEELLELSEATGDKLARRNALTGLGMAARHQGRSAESLPLFREALELARESGEPWILATSIFNVGQPLLETGDLDEGEEVLEEARRRYLALGDAAFAMRMNLYLARSALLKGQLKRARTYVVEAVPVFEELDEPWGQVECLEIAGAILAAGGADPAAAHALGAARAAHALLGSAQLVPDELLVAPLLEAARRRAGEVWDVAYGAGLEMPLGQALADAAMDLRSLQG